MIVKSRAKQYKWNSIAREEFQFFCEFNNVPNVGKAQVFPLNAIDEKSGNCTRVALLEIALVGSVEN